MLLGLVLIIIVHFGLRSHTLLEVSEQDGIVGMHLGTGSL